MIKFLKSISFICKNIKNKKINIIEVAHSVIKIWINSFFSWCRRWRKVKNIATKKIYAAGTCLLKKAKNKKTGTNNHKLNLLVLNDLISKIIAIIDNKVEWWSTKGVPLDGYANIEKQIV